MRKGTLIGSSVTAGAAFLMATSAIGPGFLTQTTIFTKEFGASMGFVILLSVILDIFAQLNIWRVLTVSGMRGQEVADRSLPGTGLILAILVAVGGFAFNIGNVAGAGLGINVLFGDLGLSVEMGALLSASIAILIFITPKAGSTMDIFVKVLGVLMLLAIVYIVFAAQPPINEAITRTFLPLVIDPRAIVTLVGGTVGGYISFAGAHRLIDAGKTGIESVGEVDRGAVTGILFTAVFRFLLFLAALGVVAGGFAIDLGNPPASVFQNAAGMIGYRFFGVVMWAAAITSVVGAAFTSVSFLKTIHPLIAKNERLAIALFIVASTAVFLSIEKPPAQLLVWAGTVNGFILPIGLGAILLGARRRSIVGDYRHPTWLLVAGAVVVLTMLGFSLATLWSSFG